MHPGKQKQRWRMKCFYVSDTEWGLCLNCFSTLLLVLKGSITWSHACQRARICGLLHEQQSISDTSITFIIMTTAFDLLSKQSRVKSCSASCSCLSCVCSSLTESKRLVWLMFLPMDSHISMTARVNQLVLLLKQKAVLWKDKHHFLSR